MSFGTPGSPDDPLQADAGLGPTELTPWAAPGPLAAAGPGGRGLPPGLAGPPSPADYLRGLRRRWGLALFGGLTCAVAAALAAWFFVPTKKYTATAMLIVKQVLPSILDTGNLQAGHDYVTYQKTQESLVTSPFVISAALRDPSIARLSILRDEKDPIEWLGKRLDTRFNGELLQISLGGNQPQEIAAVVNAIVDAYINEVVNKERNNRMARLETLRKIYNDRQKNLEAQRKTLHDLAEVAGTNDPETLAVKHKIELERHQEAERTLSRVKQDRIRAEVELTALEAEVKAHAGRPDLSPQELDQLVSSDPVVQGYSDQINQLTATMTSYRGASRNGTDPALRRLHDQRMQARRAMEQRREEVLQEIRRAQAAPMENPKQVERDAAAHNLAVLRGFEQELRSEVERLKKGMTDFGKNALEQESIQDEIRVADQGVERIGQEIERLTVEVEAPMRVELLQHATPPVSINRKAQAQAAGLAGLGALGLVLLGIAWWETRGRRVDTVDDVVRGLGIDLVGVLPALPERSRRGLSRAADAQRNNLLLESVDATCAMLLHASRAEALKVLMIASAQLGEGKTSLACHLATSLARARRRTLLIDCDLRMPAAHRMFDVPLESGVCEVLRGQVDVAEAIQPTLAGNLAILTAGRVDVLAIQGLAQGRLGAILERLRPQYDFIIIDTAPVLPVADSLHVCQHVDAVIFSVLRDVSRLPKVYAAHERLAKLHVRVLGAVVSGTPWDGDVEASYAYAGQAEPRAELPA